MKPIFTYKGQKYSYVVMSGEVITYRINHNNPEDDFEFDEDMQKQLAMEFAGYEATLSDSELRIWRGEE